MNRGKRLALSIIAALGLCVALAAAAYAFFYITLDWKDNYFRTGRVDVEIAFLPGELGKMDLHNADIRYEPGMTIRGDFIVTNRSTDENGVWYRFYFTKLDGALKDVLRARIYEGDTLLLEGTVSSLTSPRAMENPLHIPYGEGGTHRRFTLELHYPREAGNAGQGGTLHYALGIMATQSTQNPRAEFE